MPDVALDITAFPANRTSIERPDQYRPDRLLE